LETVTISQLRHDAGKLVAMAALGHSVTILLNGVRAAVLGPVPGESPAATTTPAAPAVRKV
jgi:antitoxin (DNA-binding transcriptional repressor) of toxin-antitoxin stability system